MTIEFQPWPKIPRLNRNCVITEKLDGTNAAIGVVRLDSLDDSTDTIINADSEYAVYAQSRKRIITPHTDNFGFANWVYDHSNELAEVLGEGIHYGEWWGAGIGRRYGLDHKRFSLFNVNRYADIDLGSLPPNVGLVPVLYRGPFTSNHVMAQVGLLSILGSVAVPGFMDPEGVIVFHEAAGQVFKVTCKDDEKPKGSNE